MWEMRKILWQCSDNRGLGVLPSGKKNFFLSPEVNITSQNYPSSLTNQLSLLEPISNRNKVS